MPYTISWMGNSNFNQSYGGAQAREVHPLEQLPPYAPASYGWGGQDYRRYTGWGDEDFRHCGNTNGMTQSIEHTQDHAHSEVAPTADWQDYCDTADNSRVMLDSCRLHTDNDYAYDVAADPEEACVEACPTSEYTDDAQQEGKAPGTSDATASRQAHSETVPVGTEEESQQEQTQTDITQLHAEESEGISQQENPTPESPTACDAVCSDPETACTRPPRDQLPEHARDSPVSVAVSTGERELHVQDEASPSLQAASSRPLTRLRSQSVREEVKNVSSPLLKVSTKV